MDIPCNKHILRTFPTGPGYDETLQLFEYDDDSLTVWWYLYDEYYPGFETHEYTVGSIPGPRFREALGLEDNAGAVRFLTAFFEKNISANKFIRLLQTHGIPYAIVPEDEWVPGIDDGEDVSGL